MNDDLKRLTIAVEALVDFALLGLVLQHGIEAVNNAMEAIGYEIGEPDERS